MKVVVCQGETTGYPSRDELVALWREEIGKIPQVDELVVRENFDYEKMEEIAGDADALIGVWIKDEFYTDDFLTGTKSSSISQRQPTASERLMHSAPKDTWSHLPIPYMGM